MDVVELCIYKNFKHKIFTAIEFGRINLVSVHLPGQKKNKCKLTLPYRSKFGGFMDSHGTIDEIFHVKVL